MNDFAAELLKSERSGKYSPIEVAQWLEDLAGLAATQLAEAEKRAGKSTPEFRRMAADVKIQIGLGRFFAAKLRSGTLYAIHEQSGDRRALEHAITAYRQAREIWSAFAREASSVYVSDITYSPRPNLRGHWMDRLPAIDDDIAAMAAKRVESAQEDREQSPQLLSAIVEALGHPHVVEE